MRLSRFGHSPGARASRRSRPSLPTINLSLDDSYLDVSCWGTGELRQYDVRDPFNPTLAGSVRIGGIVERMPIRAARINR